MYLRSPYSISSGSRTQAPQKIMILLITGVHHSSMSQLCRGNFSMRMSSETSYTNSIALKIKDYFELQQ